MRTSLNFPGIWSILVVTLGRVSDELVRHMEVFLA